MELQPRPKLINDVYQPLIHNPLAIGTAAVLPFALLPFPLPLSLSLSLSLWGDSWDSSKCLAEQPVSPVGRPSARNGGPVLQIGNSAGQIMSKCCCCCCCCQDSCHVAGQSGPVQLISETRISNRDSRDCPDPVWFIRIGLHKTQWGELANASLRNITATTARGHLGGGGEGGGKGAGR